jgi:hypothetical protein
VFLERGAPRKKKNPEQQHTTKMGVDPSSLVLATVTAQSENCSLVFRVYLVDFFYETIINQL